MSNETQGGVKDAIKAFFTDHPATEIGVHELCGQLRKRNPGTWKFVDSHVRSVLSNLVEGRWLVECSPGVFSKNCKSNSVTQSMAEKRKSALSGNEDRIKEVLERYLEARGWRVTSVARGSQSGPDFVATKNGQSWFIEVKGRGKEGVYPDFDLKGFLTGLGQLVTRMNDPTDKYSMAFPDISQYRSKWEGRVSKWIQETLHLTAFFVDGETVEEVGISVSLE